MKFFGLILGLKASGFKKGLDDAKKDVKSFKKEVEEGGGLFGKLGDMKGAIAGLAGGAGLGAWLKGGFDYAGQLQDKADQLGVSVERLQAINEGLAGAGLGPEDTEKTLTTLRSSIADALEGSEEMQDSFERLGVSMDDIFASGGSPDEVFYKVADGFAAAEDKGKALNDVIAIMGKSGKKMAGALGEGSKPFTDAEKGLAISSKQAAEADKLGDRIASLVKKFTKTAPGKVAGMASEAVNKLTDGDEWAKNLAGQRAAYEAMKGKDPLEGLTPYQRDLVNKHGLSPEQARTMKPGAVEAKKNAETIAKEKELHETQNQMAAKEGQFALAIKEAEEKFGARDSAEKRKFLFEKRAKFLGNRAKNADPATAAEARAELASLIRSRVDEKMDENLMTPQEKAEKRRQESRRARAQRKAARQVAKELGGQIFDPNGKAPSDPMLSEIKAALVGVDATLKDRLKWPK